MTIQLLSLSNHIDTITMFGDELVFIKCGYKTYLVKHDKAIQGNKWIEIENPKLCNETNCFKIKNKYVSLLKQVKRINATSERKIKQEIGKTAN